MTALTALTLSAWADPPVAPQVRHSFDGPPPLLDAVGALAVTALGGGAQQVSASFHPCAGDALEWTGDAPVLGGQPATPLAGPFTVAGWVRPSGCTASNRCVLVSQGDTNAASSQGFMLYVRLLKPAIEFQFANGEQLIEGPDPVDPDAWVWLAARSDGARVELFADGARVADSGPTSPIAHAAGPLQLGHIPNRAYGMRGTVDEVLVFDRALDDAELQTLWSWYTLPDANGRVMGVDCAVPAPIDTGGGDTGIEDTASGGTGDTGETRDTGEAADTATGETGEPTPVDTSDTGPAPDTGVSHTGSPADTGAPDTGDPSDSGRTRLSGCRCVNGSGGGTGPLALVIALAALRRRAGGRSRRFGSRSEIFAGQPRRLV